MSLGQPHYAGFWRRALAALLDWLIFLLAIRLLAITVHIAHTGFDTFFGAGASWQRLLAFDMFEGALGIVLTLLLMAYCWSRFLGTPGKLLLACHVLDARTGRPIALPQALVRALGYFASALPLMLGFAWAGWDRRKQALHDKLAGTVVVVESGMERYDESQKPLAQLIKELR